MFIDQVMDEGFNDDPLDLPADATPVGGGKEGVATPMSPDSVDFDEVGLSLPTPQRQRRSRPID